MPMPVSPPRRLRGDAKGRIRLQTLGPLRVECDDVELTLRPAERRLLAILALAPGHQLDTERLIDQMWGDEMPRTARAALQVHVSAVRRKLGDTSLASDRSGYRLAVHEVDATLYLSLAQEAHEAHGASEWRSCVDTITRAETLWRDAPYPELRYDEFAHPTIARLEETRLGLLELQAEARLALGLHREAIPELEALLAEYPLRERLWEHLMTARYRIGRFAEALEAYQTVEAHLADIGAEPGAELRRLKAQILRRDETLTLPRTNLPISLTSFVGRPNELRALTQSIHDQRLVTLTGAGGSGKTRLAIEAARGLTPSFPEGVWLADLAAVQDESQVATEIARALGLQPASSDVLEAVAEATSLSTVLVVLDNCEHLRESAAAAAQRLLQSAPDLTLLVTSREPLRVPGEFVYEVPGMTVPSDVLPDLDVARTFEAVTLFQERAIHSDRSFQLGRENVAAVVSICCRLDGLPLAIELAAARTRSMSVQDIADRLDDRLGLLTTGAATAPRRHQTLRATIDWSYRLLSDTERMVMDALSVFRGGFQLDAAEEVASGAGLLPHQVTSVVSDLVDKSLIGTRRVDGGIRYLLLETVRQYAEARLEADGLAEAVRRRHLQWCSSITGDLWERALGLGKAALAATLDAESDNLQGGLEFARSRGESGAFVHLSHAMGWRWYLIGHMGRAAAMLQSTLPSTSDPRAEGVARALLARCLAYSEDNVGAQREAKKAHRSMASLDRPLEKTWVAYTLQLVTSMSVRSDPQRMLALAGEAAEIALGSGDLSAEMLARQALADAHCWNGRTDEGLEQQRIVLDMAAGTGDAMTIHQFFGQSIYNYMLDPAARRTEPRRVTERWLSLVPLDVDAWRSVATDWLPWVYLQDGDVERAEKAVSAMGGRTLEGYNRTIHLIVRATVAWMRGLLDQAWADAQDLSGRPINPRWAHTQYPLVAEVAADLGYVDEVRRVADAFIAMEVHPSREATKLGVLGPLVRAEVDAALRDDSGDHASRAEAALTDMRRILLEHPPRVDSWLSIMTHTQNAAFATAELSRLTGSNPDLWAGALAVADYAYYRTYARWRLGEALLDAGAANRGGKELRAAHAEAVGSGAGYLQRRVLATARRFGIDLG